MADISIVGMDAHWSEFGEYLSEIVEIIQAQWHSIIHDSRVSPPHGSYVIVTFR